VFAGIENGKPAVLFFNLQARIDGSQVYIFAPPAKPPKGNEGGVGIGVVEDGLRYIAEHRNRIDTDPAGVIRDSVAVEAKADPTHVGGKISILHLTSKGAEWIDKGECQ
jgi:hypothetical protein